MSVNRNALFATTRWTMVLKAGDDDGGDSSAKALEELCRIYWYPLYAYVRHRGYRKEDAEDLTQGFFARLLEHRDFAGLDAERGRFRAFLLASLKNYMANEYDRGQCVKRGGGFPHLSLDWVREGKRLELEDESAKSPEEIYDREWALVLLENVLSLLREEWEGKGHAAGFEQMKVFLSVGGHEATYRETALQLGVTETSLRVAAHRLRKRYRELLKDGISRTLSSPEMVREEIKALMGIFQ